MLVQKNYKVSDEDRFFAYVWSEKQLPNQTKFGDHWVKAGLDPIKDTKEYIRSSMSRRKDLFDDGSVKISVILDISDFAKKHNRFKKHGKIDEIIKKHLKSFHKQDDVYNLNSEEFINKLGFILNPPLRGKELTTYLKTKCIEYKSDYIIEQASKEGYKLPSIEDLNQEEELYFKRGLNLIEQEILLYTNYKQYSLKDRDNKSKHSFKGIIKQSKTDKSAEKFINQWYDKVKKTSYINTVNKQEEVEKFKKSPEEWMSSCLYKIDKFSTPEKLLKGYLKLHKINVTLSKVKDRLFQINSTHPTTKSYFCNFTEGQKDPSQNEAKNVYVRMIELINENPNNKLIFIVADYQSGKVLNFIKRTQLEGIKKLPKIENNNWDIQSIEDWVTTRTL